MASDNHSLKKAVNDQAAENAGCLFVFGALIVGIGIGVIWGIGFGILSFGGACLFLALISIANVIMNGKSK